MAFMQQPVLLADIYEDCLCGKKRVCRCGAAEMPRPGDPPQDIADLSVYPRVFAVDPGTHTGWACLWFDSDVLFDKSVKVSAAPVAWQAGMVIGPEMSQVDALSARLRSVGFGGEGLAVVVEDFVVRTIKMERTFLSPVRVGHMLAYSLHRGAREHDGVWRTRGVAAWQSPNDALNVCTDSRLKLWNTYLPGADHPRDATRHAHLYLRALKGAGEDVYDRNHFVDEEDATSE